jgi:hypothetical protein
MCGKTVQNGDDMNTKKKCVNCHHEMWREKMRNARNLEDFT